MENRPQRPVDFQVRRLYLCRSPPYGYLKDPHDKEKWIVDEDAAKVVWRIYDLCIDGKGASQIARILWNDKVPTLAAHIRNMGVNTHHKEPADPYRWSDSSVESILTRMEYLGVMVNFKHYKKSYKKKRSYRNKPEKWVIFEDAHPAIIGKAQRERVQELCKNKKRLTKSGKARLFSGLIHCADCKGKLHFRTCKSFSDSQDNYVCSQYKSAMRFCTAHFIR